MGLPPSRSGSVGPRRDRAGRRGGQGRNSKLFSFLSGQLSALAPQTRAAGPAVGGEASVSHTRDLLIPAAANKLRAGSSSSGMPTPESS